MDKCIIGLGNALADILTRIESDDILDNLGFGRGSMHLVGRDTHERISGLLSSFETKVVSGGSAANTMRGLARLGVPCSYIGKIGPDAVGDFMRNEMNSLGVHPQLIESDTPTGRCMVLISPDGERTMATFLGAAVELAPEEIGPELFDGCDILHIEGYLVQNHGLIRRAVQTAKAAGLTISLDMASYNVVEENHGFLTELVRGYVDLLFANEDEARAFTGQEPEEAVHTIGGLCNIAVVKTGAKGSLIACGDDVFAVDAAPAQVVDTTGAGDLYATGFLYGLSKGLPLRECGEIGSLVAAKAIETVGPTLTPDRLEMILTQLGKRKKIMETVDFTIRRETNDDLAEVYTLIRTAFETAKVKDGDEQDFAVKLRESDAFVPELSLVAEAGGGIIGHALLTKTFVAQPDGSRYIGLLVAPLSVALEWRGKGVGAALVEEGLRLAREQGYGAAFLCGDPAYYRRFGFRPTADFGIRPQADIPPQFVMALELFPGALAGVTGTGDFC